MKICAKKTEVLWLCMVNPSQCTLQVSGNRLQQVKKFSYLGLVFTSEGKRNKEIIKGLEKQNQFYMSSIILWSQNELWGHKTSAFKYRKAVNFEIGLCSNSHLCSWILGNEWKSVHRVTLRNKMRSCEIRKALNIEPFILRLKRSQPALWFGRVSRMP